ncbi:MAG: hypothetical protein M3Y48_21050 [Actinomycetota bacterium]|nr:hypothetical protein [Actinomycetota bacterium]
MSDELGTTTTTTTTTISDTAVSNGSGASIPTSRRHRRIPRNLSTR